MSSNTNTNTNTKTNREEADGTVNFSAQKDVAAPKRSLVSRSLVSRLLGWLFTLVAILVWLWCIGGALCMEDILPKLAQQILAAVIAIGVPIGWFLLRKRSKSTSFMKFAPVGLAWMIVFGLLSTVRPSHDREWTLPQRVLPSAKISGNQVEIQGIRAFRYGPVSQERLTYDDKYDLDKLETVWFGVDRFTDVEALAHTFLSFGFSDGEHRSNYLAFSVETRREIDEEMYSPMAGIYKNYEVIYVIADEQDVLSVRSDVRENVVQLYPVKTTKKLARQLFVNMLQRANGIRETPEFYHTLKNNCTNNIVYHSNQLLDNPISTFQQGVVFPGYSDWLALKLGLIDTDLTLEEAREKFRIDQRVKAYDGKSNFSKFIRGQE